MKKRVENKLFSIILVDKVHTTERRNQRSMFHRLSCSERTSRNRFRLVLAQMGSGRSRFVFNHGNLVELFLHRRIQLSDVDGGNRRFGGSCLLEYTEYLSGN